MGNSKSTRIEHQPEEDVTTGMMQSINYSYSCETCISDSDKLIAGLTSGRSDEEYNASIIPIPVVVDNSYTTEPGIILCEDWL
jgi:hypothetical protein